MKRTQARLIVIGGFAGAGKSSAARRLSQTLKLPVFEIDHLARSIRDSRDFGGSHEASYRVAFDVFFTFAESHLENGNSLILDQNMGHAVTWQNVEQLARNLPQAEVVVFILDCPYEICVERFAKRTEHPNLDGVPVELLDEHKHKWDYLNENTFERAHRIDATRAPDAVFDDILNRL